MSDKSIERRAMENATVGVISFFITLCQAIALVPILLKFWGNASYGIWLVVMAGFNLLQTLDLGHQNYVGNQLNLQYHSDTMSFRRTLGSSLLIAYFLGLIEVIICLFLIFSGKLSLFLGISEQVIADNNLVIGLLMLMTMWLIFGSIGGIVVRIMIPVGMLYQGQWLGIAVRLCQFISIVIVATSNGDILDACLWYAITQSVMSIIILSYIKFKIPQFYPWWQAGKWRDGLINLRKSLVLTFNSISQQLSNNGLLILMSMLFGAAVIPSFATLRTLTNTAGAVTTIFISSMLPDIIRFHATREANKLTSALNANWFISGICVNFGIILVLPGIEPIYRYWTKGVLEFNSSLFLLLAVAISLANFGSGLNLYLQGINDLRSQTVITITRTTALFVVGYLFSGIYGIQSIGIGCVVAEVLASVLLPVFFVNKRLNDFSIQLSTKHVGLAILPPALLMIAGGVNMTSSIDFSLVTMIVLPILVTIYWTNWKVLDQVVQDKINSLATSIYRMVSFNL